MNKKYKNKFIFALNYYCDNDGTPYIFIPSDYFVTAEDIALKKVASKWVEYLLKSNAKEVLNAFN